MRNYILVAVVLGLLLISGCVHSSSVFLLDCDLDDYMGTADLRLEYRGTKDYFHYFDLRHDGKLTRYRISTYGLNVQKPFPLGTDRREVYWISLDAYGPERAEAMDGHRWVLEPIDEQLYKLRLAPEEDSGK